MDSFTSSASGAGSSQFSNEEFMDKLKLQLAQAYAQEFLETVTGKCFEKCITKPGSSLSGSESSCVSRCVDRYIEATGIIGRALFTASTFALFLAPLPFFLPDSTQIKLRYSMNLWERLTPQAPIPGRLNLTEVQISDGTIHLIDLEGLYGPLDWPGMPRCWLLSGEELWDPGGSNQ
ncbi:mitochondrial import inner membrane translocase subunit [Citrus sinensis]|nr:mitochondrial import inner membrane translocase subunit [Citrus sinensis]